ncbi:DNA repair-scaffolding protein isoform X2 [Nannospalax galili]|uniref:DNA repair-scaffolding protein isoform X2 n=1 Tax=Nannospalax galili TaxID=1026970 RepID=UPI0004ECFE9C|nr:DNA repair-scaffolding protein isoform X2 [Nannospalax galili]
MSRGGRAGGYKRKRNWDIEHSSFLEDRPQQLRRTSLKSVGTAASLSKAWLKCGEGFQDSAETLPLVSEKATVTEKQRELSPRPEKETTSKHISDLGNITWSSSSDEDKTLSKSQRDGHGSRIHRFHNRSTPCPEDGASEDELQFIDWESSSDSEDAGEYSECEGGEGTMDISDCASCASSDGRLHQLQPISTEILEYSSESDKEDDPENVLFIDADSPHKYSVDFESDTRQIMHRLIDSKAKSTEPSLNSPQKETAKFPKTLENSATKKKLLRGGLAERLNGLQNRERSAVSLWRHQCAPYQKTLLGRKSGVLTVKILELHEECTMQVAMCEQLEGPPTTRLSKGISPRPEVYLKVLFTRETAGHLRGHPQDVICIFPPWQKLIMPNGSCPVILNTYFCQKAVAKETPHEAHCQASPLSRRNITLAQMFRIKTLSNNSPGSQIECSSLATAGTGWTHRPEEAEQHLAVGTPLGASLLDIAESQTAGTWSEVGVRVVVQRAYSLLGRDSAKGQQGHSAEHADSSGARLCLLVQDTYGMLGEVHLEGTVWRSRHLEGKSCSVTGMKVLQKTTRGRTPGLFSLIDTIWPPVMPLTMPGHGQPSEEATTYLPPPMFCYIFSVHPSLGQVDIIEGDPISKLYQPPVVRCLREVLQGDECGVRCSFCATVIYQRPQLKNLLPLEQTEIWLLVTDVTLQTQDKNNHCLPRTLPVCVTPLCVLSPEVLEALAMARPGALLFRDALRDHGRIVCVERTVLLPQKPVLCMPSGAGPCELTGPVMLDELDSLTPVNSICSVQGAVVGVDENTAFSWPVCDQCGKGRLEQRPEDGGTFFCVDCFRPVMSPPQKRHLQVFLDCPTRPQSTVKVKLLQSSISSLLRFAASEDGSYEVESVLGKEMGSLLCFVQSVTTHPANCIELEEIELRGGATANQSPFWDP